MATIGIDARMYGPLQTGIGTYIEYLVHYLAQIDKTNRYVLFMLPGARAEKALIVKHFKIVPAEAHWYSLAEQTRFVRTLYRERLDLTHFPHFNVPLLYRRPYVVTIHDLTPKFFPGHKAGKSAFRRWAYNVVLTNAVHRARHIIAPSEFTKDDITRYLHVPPECVSVIYEGVKDKLSIAERIELLEQFEALKQKAFQRLRVNYGHTALRRPFIFYVGVWRNHKNVVGLIKAFHLLVDKYKLDFQLVIGGKEDPHYPEVRAMWRTLGLKDRVYAPGMLFGKELSLFYRAARLFALPSFYEGFGLVAVEALNQGTPVVASQFGPIPEVLGHSAHYFNPREPADMAKVMAEILRHPLLQKQLVTSGQQRLARYDWRTMAEETLSVYQRALE